MMCFEGIRVFLWRQIHIMELVNAIHAWSEFQKSRSVLLLSRLPTIFVNFCFDGWFIFPLGYFRASPGHSSSQYHFQSSAKSGIIWDYSGAPLCINVSDLPSQTPSGSEAQMSRGCSDLDELLSNIETECEQWRGIGCLSLSALNLILDRAEQSCRLNNNCIHKVSILQTCLPNL